MSIIGVFMIDSDGNLRCDECRRKVGVPKIKDGRFEWVCPRCKHFNVFEVRKSYNSHKVVVLENEV